MSNPSATVQAAAMIAFRDQGIVSLNPSVPQANTLQDSDLDAMVMCVNQSFQEAADESPDEHLRQPGSAWVPAPITIIVNVVQGSLNIFLGTYSTQMNGCTIRISGDDMDNEILSATVLARPYEGGTSSGIAATVYFDVINIDATVEKVLSPMMLSGNRFVYEASTRAEFISQCWIPFYNSANGVNIVGMTYLPFWAIGPKPAGPFPSVFFLDTYYDQAQDHTIRRIRLSPMPTQSQTIFWTNKMTPIRVTRADIVSGLNTITASGATSDTQINQDYDYICDLNGYRAFSGVTHAAYGCYFHPTLNVYILSSTFSLAAVPTSYWVSALGSSPLGVFNVVGSAIGTVNVVTSDSGGGAADPGTKINMPNGWVESIFVPLLRQRASGAPTFKNEQMRPEIKRQYDRALGILRSARVSAAPAKTGYV